MRPPGLPRQQLSGKRVGPSQLHGDLGSLRPGAQTPERTWSGERPWVILWPSVSLSVKRGPAHLGEPVQSQSRRVLCVGALGAVPCCCASHGDCRWQEADRSGREGWFPCSQPVGQALRTLVKLLTPRGASCLSCCRRGRGGQRPRAVSCAHHGTGLGWVGKGFFFAVCVPAKRWGPCRPRRDCRPAPPCGSVGRVKALGRQRLGLNLFLCSDVQLFLMSVSTWSPPSCTAVASVLISCVE